MIKEFSVIEVKIRLDPIPGWGHQPEDHVKLLEQALKNSVAHYNPSVKLIRIEEVK